MNNTATDGDAGAVGSGQRGSITGADTAGVCATLTPGPNQEGHISLSTAVQSTQQSPGQRGFLVDSAISHLCTPAAGTIVRYSG